MISTWVGAEPEGLVDEGTADVLTEDDDLTLLVFAVDVVTFLLVVVVAALFSACILRPMLLDGYVGG